ncbi:MAG: hypothetical protein HYR58_05460 [Acidobacteria bacterium]|nr:hypothetical protein [Acidobacteriota bacterium]
MSIARNHFVLGAVLVFIAGLLPAAVATTGQTQTPPTQQPGPQQAGGEDHQASILGIEIGMTPQQVMERLGRTADGAKDEKDEIVLRWKLPGGDVLQVNLRRSNERVSFLGLHYAKPRPATDLWLVPLSSPTAQAYVNRNPHQAESARTNTGAPAADTSASSAAIPGATPASSAGGVQLPVDPIAPNPYEHKDPGRLTARDPRLRTDYKTSETRDKMRTVWVREEKSPAGYRVEVSFLSGDRKQYGDRFEEYVDYKYVSVGKEDLKKFDEIK